MITKYLIAATSSLAIYMSSASAQDVNTASATVTPQAADSESARSEAVGDIVVTAQRRSQRLQDVAIAVSAYSGEELRTKGIVSSADVARMTPGVYQSGSVGGQSTQFSIRGVTQSDFNDAVEAPVAVYIDEGYVASQQGQTLALFDVDRVEVLKGPQGTLFGRNATGGLVHFVVSKPTDVITGYFNASLARFDNVRLEGAIGGPLADGVSTRISFYYQQNGNMWKNIYPAGYPANPSRPLNIGGSLAPCCSDLGSQRTIAGRMQLMVEPTDRLNIRFTGSISDQKLSAGMYTSASTIGHLDAQGRLVEVTRAAPGETRIAIAADGSNSSIGSFLEDPSGGRPVAGGNFFGFIAPNIKDRLFSNDVAAQDVNWVKNYGAAMHVNYDMGWAHFVSISDFKRNEKQFIIDLDGSPINTGTYATKSTNDMFSQEIRLSHEGDNLKWVAGGYYLNIAAKSVNGLPAPRGSYLAQAFGMASTGVDLDSDFALHTESMSAFGQAEWEFMPRVTLVGGARIIKEKQRYRYDSYAAQNDNDYAIDSATILFPLNPSFRDRRSKTLWAGKVQLEYRPSRDALIYAGVNRGVKAGSYNAKLPDGTGPLAPGNIPYKPETLTSYEGGFKLSLANRRVTVNGSLYYYDYKNYQAFTFVDVSGFVQNRDARTIGAELSIVAEPIEGLTVSVAGSILDAKVKNLEIAPGVARSVKPAYTPERQLSGQLTYKLPQPVLDGTLSATVDGNYTSDVYHNIRNFSADNFAGYFLGNASLNWVSESKSWSLSAFVKNITDKRYKTIGFDFAAFIGANLEAYGSPRTYGVSASYKF